MGKRILRGQYAPPIEDPVQRETPWHPAKELSVKRQAKPRKPLAHFGLDATDGAEQAAKKRCRVQFGSLRSARCSQQHDQRNVHKWKHKRGQVTLIRLHSPDSSSLKKSSKHDPPHIHRHQHLQVLLVWLNGWKCLVVLKVSVHFDTHQAVTW